MKTVPTVAELAAMGRHLAYATNFVAGDRKGDPPKPTKWHITAEGHALLGAIMAENAAEAVAAGKGNWTRPPSSGKVLAH